MTFIDTVANANRENSTSLFSKRAKLVIISLAAFSLVACGGKIPSEVESAQTPSVTPIFKVFDPEIYYKDLLEFATPLKGNVQVLNDECMVNGDFTSNAPSDKNLPGNLVGKTYLVKNPLVAVNKNNLQIYYAADGNPDDNNEDNTFVKLNKIPTIYSNSRVVSCGGDVLGVKNINKLTSKETNKQNTKEILNCVVISESEGGFDVSCDNSDVTRAGKLKEQIIHKDTLNR